MNFYLKNIEDSEENKQPSHEKIAKIEESKDCISPNKKSIADMNPSENKHLPEENNLTPCTDSSTTLAITSAPSSEEDILARSEFATSTSEKNKEITMSQSVTDFHDKIRAESRPPFDKGAKKVSHMDAINKGLNNATQKIVQKSGEIQKKEEFVKASFSSRYHINESEKSGRLPLPQKFKQLIRIASTLDRTINYFKVRNRLLILDDLRTSVETAISTYFSIVFEKIARSLTNTILTQLFRIVPEFYTHYWQITSRKIAQLFINTPVDFATTLPQISYDLPTLETAQKICDIETEIPKGPPIILKENELKRRSEILYERIFSITLAEYNEYCTIHKVENYDIYEKGNWHPLFNPHVLELKESINLKPKPNDQESESVSEFIKKNDLKKIYVQAALESVKITKTQSPKPKSFSQPAQKTYLDQKIMQKIQAKEKALTECKKEIEERVETTEQKSKEFRLTKLAETLKTIFSTQKASMSPLESVIEKLRDNERGQFFTQCIFFVIRKNL